jgi:hypothetical protein
MCISIVGLLASAPFSQAPEPPPTFEIAGVHASPFIRTPYMQGGILRNGRYELRQATMLDLIKTAYTADAATVFGGSGWIGTALMWSPKRRYPPPKTLRLMLQALLADRFRLVIHKDTKPMPVFVLTRGKGESKLKETDGSGASGCWVQRPPPSRGTVHRGLLQKRDDGDVLPNVAAGVTIFEALEKQLCLKLELQKRPMPVIVVDSVNQKPTPKAPEVTRSLPAASPAEFGVAANTAEFAGHRAISAISIPARWPANGQGISSASHDHASLEPGR